mmetsp:Transcript_47634/g.55685  ORF Transcript_47634/g.55685 Transcript_47634/m.55685 type:complete len:157 (+) Transcript_47634:194-664(+)|eukprot:CAMPEP_0194379570 /NCGR_PEP_ID=MMETSP0174-20130528/40128_1 /TAXON_ID=216777 /ORGANISM="Proboscia alata, Strain PI-D3" /LENGTH=156 /DNA_ID=CAMNT_0039162371 /DNA_START=167 /DNA_END=637 /DNA_ORIENTATION=+
MIRRTVFLLVLALVADCLANVLALSNSPSSTNAAVTFRVCQGSGCTSKCRGSFDPKKSLERLAEDSEIVVDIEESFCMNQCKRGPNARMIRNGQVVIFDEENVMNETEKRRKTFQSVRNDGCVERIWGLGMDLAKGNIMGIDSGSVETLSDIMPQM